MDYIRTSNGEKVNNTQWHNVLAWGKTAEIFCVAKDKCREELFATKIISAKVGSGISAVEVVIPGLLDYITKKVCRKL